MTGALLCISLAIFAARHCVQHDPRMHASPGLTTGSVLHALSLSGARHWSITHACALSLDRRQHLALHPKTGCHLSRSWCNGAAASDDARLRSLGAERHAAPSAHTCSSDSGNLLSMRKTAASLSKAESVFLQCPPRRVPLCS